MHNDAPTLEEITQLTRQELTTASKIDPIRECGRAALALLPSDPDTGLKLAYQKLHDVPYKDVKTCWRRLYTDASLWKIIEVAEERGIAQDRDALGSGQRGLSEKGEWLDEVVRLLDMAFILTAAPQREEIVELWFAALKAMLPSWNAPDTEYTMKDLQRPPKRKKIVVEPFGVIWGPLRFPGKLPPVPPTLPYPLLRSQELSQSAFQAKISATTTHTPIIIVGALQHWPALDERPWSSPGYLLEQTLGGRRLVPIEVGKSYTDEGWGQKIITFREFMETYMLEPKVLGKTGEEVRQTGYLAQHDLFAQIPSLRADISIPDYCYCDPAPSPHLTHIKATPKLEDPLLNAWFGPAGTVSPLHTDPYHNILAQVVGYKYVRLYAPEETEKLYPRGVDEKGVDMSNTSQVDLDEAMKVWPEISCWHHEDSVDADTVDQLRKDFENLFPYFRKATYVEGILAPGECLYLPVGWWHYIRSLTPSFSVSFWFN
jgi:lysine-specific demethylase 8